MISRENNFFMNAEGIVYIIQESPGRNVLSAEKYGKLKTCLPSNRQIVLSPGPTVFKLKKALSSFSDDDYLLMMGDPSIIGVACAIASNNNRGKFKVLKWDKQETKYYPIQINLFEKGELDD